VLEIVFLSGLVTYYPAVSTFVEQVCPHCGAPLNLDQLGPCRWCHAQIRINPASPTVAEYMRQEPRESDLLYGS